MSKAKKSTQPTPAEHEGKGFFALAGEAFSVLGDEIAEGKDKVMEVAAAKIADVKKAIKKITHKKSPVARRPVKKAGAKRPQKKAATKRATGAKKAVKKGAIVPKKALKKAKPAPKKSPKKQASGR
jgi:hypothetical protein